MPPYSVQVAPSACRKNIITTPTDSLKLNPLESSNPLDGYPGRPSFPCESPMAV